MLNDERSVISQRGIVRMLTADPKNPGKNDGPEKGDLGRYLERLPSKFRHLATDPSIQFRQSHGGVARGREAERVIEILQVFDQASDEGQLDSRQEHLARNAGVSSGNRARAS